MVNAADRPEFAEIPDHVKERVEKELEGAVFELLHAEAVKRGELPPPPGTLFNRLPGRFLVILMQLGLGAVVGALAMIIGIYTLRSFATAL